jgi:hypothetical protein
MSSSLYRIFNQGEIAGLAAGWRSVIALKPGRRWITILDWTTLESTRLPLDLWQRMGPQPAIGYSARRVRACPGLDPGAAIKARLRYVRKTRTISAAARLLK